MHRGSFLGSGWSRTGGSSMGVVRRAHPASGAQWNVQVVRGKVNEKCLWNACKALSLGLLLMALGAAMATIGYYADHLSIAQEVRGNYTVKIRNESRGFHLNNLSYAGPIVMGVGGFIVVAACVMTFEARDSAAKVVPARLKVSSAPSSGASCSRSIHNDHTLLRTAGSQTTTTQHQFHLPHSHQHPAQHVHQHHDADRRALTHSFMQFSKGLVLDPTQPLRNCNSLRVQQQLSVNKSPSAPNLSRENSSGEGIEKSPLQPSAPGSGSPRGNRRTVAASALLNPGFLQRHALSVDETSPSFRNDLQPDIGSQGSMALDLHLECPVTLRIKDRRRNPLRRQQRVDEDDRLNETSRRSSHSCSPRLSTRHLRDSGTTGGSAHQLPTYQPQHPSRRRSSNASECGHRSRPLRRECVHARGRLERAISSDSRLTGAIPKCHHHQYPFQTSSDQEVGESKSDTDLHQPHILTHVSVHKA